MGYVPADAQWFIADLVFECRIEGEPRNVLHVDQTLVRADSAEDAYAKALILGEAKNLDYLNTEGQQVVWTFRGLRDLLVIHDALEHGAELSFEEEVDVPEVRILEEISTKADLCVFREPGPILSPNYMPRDVMSQVIEALGKCSFQGSTPSPEDPH